MPMSKKIETMTPDQIAAKGRELIRLAKRKEAELRQRQHLQIGNIFSQEIHSGWPTPWDILSAQLESILNIKITAPTWITEQHKSQTLSAPGGFNASSQAHISQQ